jgi:hypothetical protein
MSTVCRKHDMNVKMTIEYHIDIKIMSNVTWDSLDFH